LQPWARIMSNTQYEALKKALGRKPFDEYFPGNAMRGRCPIHGGDNATAFHLRQENGIWLGRCETDCGRSFDAIAFTAAIDRSSQHAAFVKLVGNSQMPEKDEQEPAPEKPPEEPHAFNYSMEQLARAEAALATSKLAQDFLASRGISLQKAMELHFGFEDWRLVMPTFVDDDELVQTKLRSLKLRNG
jgi:hypothetical protein